jgi:hypothetical protein
MRYMITPRDHKSTSLPYGFYSKTSGATYDKVPNGSRLDSFGPIILERPKSTIFKLDLLSSETKRMFSGFKSLWATPKEWR